jgi:hypothetical protein
MPIITIDQILNLKPGYDHDFPNHDRNVVECPDRITPVLNAMGYFCVSCHQHDSQDHYVFQRDPWESEIVIRPTTI